MVTHFPQLLFLCFHLFIHCSLVFALSGCKEDSSPQRGTSPAVITFKNYTIPILPTAEEQYSYTRSWFKETDEKLASLEAVSHLFPKDRLQGGMAALDLTYARLGYDFRLAEHSKAQDVANRYGHILQEYGDIPEIAAKVHWYLGWVYCDLLKDSSSGIHHFETIIAEYPTIERNLAPPIQWLTILSLPTPSLPPAVIQENDLPWSLLAALEIIRHSADDKKAHLAYTFLTKHHRPTIQGNGLKLFLNRPQVPQNILMDAQAFVQNSTPNTTVRRDIQRVLEAMTKDGVPQQTRRR